MKDTSKTVLTIGVFDGVHLGHAKLINKTVELSREKQSISCVITFDPLPEEVLEGKIGFVLTLPDEKRKIIEKSGIDYTVFFEFNKQLAQLNHLDFLRKIEALNPVGVVVGEDFRFGKNASGKPEDLMDFFKGKAEVIVEPLYKLEGVPVKSSIIRSLLEEGNVRRASKFLGRNYSLKGTVVSGKGLGRALGYPTANLEISERKLVPAAGVYAGFAVKGDIFRLPAAIFIPQRQTVGRKVVEVHIIGYDIDLYGSEVEVELIDRVSDVEEFTRLEELQEKIKRDIKRVADLILP